MGFQDDQDPRRLYYDREESWGFPGDSAVKNPFVNVGDTGDNAVLPLEKEIATSSSILAWKIPWTGEPGGLQSMGSQRVRHA